MDVSLLATILLAFHTSTRITISDPRTNSHSTMVTSIW